MWSAHQGSQTWTPSSTFQVVPFFGFFISDFILKLFFQVFLSVLETFLVDTENIFCQTVDFENFDLEFLSACILTIRFINSEIPVQEHGASRKYFVIWTKFSHKSDKNFVILSNVDNLTINTFCNHGSANHSLLQNKFQKT